MARILALLALLVPAVAAAGPSATPDAQGFGAVATGGRGGDVYHVTNLNPHGPGSLVGGVAHLKRQPRTIVFEVGGVIELHRPLKLKNRRLTIAGQTAPGGITLRGYPLVLKQSHDVIIRHLRVRPGDANAAPGNGRPGRGNADLPAGRADAVTVTQSSRILLDHLSMSWGMDETLSLTESRDVTVQNSIISESLNASYHGDGPHGYGSLLRGVGGGYTLYGNLYAHHDQRNPLVGGDQGGSGAKRRGLDLDFVNNVIYDWGRDAGHTAIGLGRIRMNYVGNVLLAGPSSRCRDCVFAYNNRRGGDSLAVHQADNWIDWEKNGDRRLRRVRTSGFQGDEPDWEDAPFAFRRPPVTPRPAREAWEQVLRGAGASRVRDAVDRRVVAQVRARSGGLIDTPRQVGGWPAQPGDERAPVDADRDGMADVWECRRGLDPADPTDRNGTGLQPPWTNLEVYLEELARPGAELPVGTPDC